MSRHSVERSTRLEHLVSILKDPQRTVLVDFDHTLFGSNSTEQFLVSCRPSFIASTVLAVIRESWIWKYTSVTKWGRLRDYISVLLSITLNPAVGRMRDGWSGELYNLG
jgi:hypothetical protein